MRGTRRPRRKEITSEQKVKELKVKERLAGSPARRAEKMTKQLRRR